MQMLEKIMCLKDKGWNNGTGLTLKGLWNNLKWR